MAKHPEPRAGTHLYNDDELDKATKTPEPECTWSGMIPS